MASGDRLLMNQFRVVFLDLMLFNLREKTSAGPVWSYPVTLRGQSYNSLEYLTLMWIVFTLDRLLKAIRLKDKYHPFKEFSCYNFFYILVLWSIFEHAQVTFHNEMDQLGLFFTAKFKTQLWHQFLETIANRFMTRFQKGYSKVSCPPQN